MFLIQLALILLVTPLVSLSLKSNNAVGKVSIVTGASRGIGKGICSELCRAGYKVYITGTTLEGPLSLQQTKKECESQGFPGSVVPFLCDHRDDAQVSSLFSHVALESGRLDVLVNNAFQLPPSFADEGSSALFGSFWDKPMDVWDSLHNVGLRSHYAATREAVPLMIETRAKHGGTPLVAMISSFGGVSYTFNVAYGVGKAGVDRMAKDMAVELKPEGIATASFWPGVVMTENMRKVVENGEWEKNVGIPIEGAESVGYTGQAIVAAARDQEGLMGKSGEVIVVAELAKEYGFREREGGGQPVSIRSLRFLIPNYALKGEMPKWMEGLIPDWKLPFFIMAGGQPD